MRIGYHLRGAQTSCYEGKYIYVLVHRNEVLEHAQDQGEEVRGRWFEACSNFSPASDALPFAHAGAAQLWTSVARGQDRARGICTSHLHCICVANTAACVLDQARSSASHAAIG